MVEQLVSPEEEVLTRARLLSDEEVATIRAAAPPEAFDSDMRRVRAALQRVLKAGYLLEHQADTFRVMENEVGALENMAVIAPQDLFKAAA